MDILTVYSASWSLATTNFSWPPETCNIDKIRFSYWKSKGSLAQPTMGCVRSKIEPLVCQKDEEVFLSNWNHYKADNRVISRKSSSDWSVVKVEGKDITNMGPGSTSCPPVHWYGDLPSILGFLLLLMFVVTIFRRWQNKPRAKRMRRALSQSMALQTVSSSVPFQSGPDMQWRGVGSRYLD